MRAKGVRLPVWQGENLLHGAVIVQGFESGFSDSNGDGVADGYTPDDANDFSFSGGVQTFNGGGATNGFTIERAFPVSGVQLTLSFNILSVGSLQNSQTRVFIDNFAGTNLELEQLGNISSTGKRVLTFVTPADTYSLDVDITNSPGGDAGLQFNDIMLSVGVDDTYVAG